MDLRNTIRLGRIAGIDIGVHYTWIVVFALVTLSLAQGLFPQRYPGWAPSAYWLAGIGAALALFVSVLAHELAHSLVAQARGLRVRSITLFIFGGVANLSDEARRPRDDFLIAIVGPLTSFVLAAAFWLVQVGLGLGRTPPGAALTYLAFVNLALAVFNLLPGFPLDGGRVLRSLIWAVTGSLRRATHIASYAGQGIGFLLILWGVWQAFDGALLNGLWTAFIGWFLNGTAEATRQAQALRESLRGVQVAELMDPSPVIVDPSTSVEEFIYHHLLRQGSRAVLVVDGGRLLGLASLTDVKAVPREGWPATSVAEIMARPPLKVVSPGSDVSAALRLLVENGLNQLPVVSDHQVVGLLSRAHVLRFLQVRDELGLADVPEPPRAARSHQIPVRAA